METIFDHNPSRVELVDFFSSIEQADMYRELIRIGAVSQDAAYAALAAFFLSVRSSRKDADKYLAMISDEEYRVYTVSQWLNGF